MESSSFKFKESAIFSVIYICLYVLAIVVFWRLYVDLQVNMFAFSLPISVGMSSLITGMVFARRKSRRFNRSEKWGFAAILALISVLVPLSIRAVSSKGGIANVIDYQITDGPELAGAIVGGGIFLVVLWVLCALFLGLGARMTKKVKTDNMLNSPS